LGFHKSKYPLHQERYKNPCGAYRSKELQIPIRKPKNFNKKNNPPNWKKRKSPKSNESNSKPEEGEP
jgi:hypothetical protein